MSGIKKTIYLWLLYPSIPVDLHGLKNYTLVKSASWNKYLQAAPTDIRSIPSLGGEKKNNTLLTQFLQNKSKVVRCTCS